MSYLKQKLKPQISELLQTKLNCGNFYEWNLFCLVFLPTTLASLPPGVILSRSTAPRDSATNIEKTSRKDVPE